MLIGVTGKIGVKLLLFYCIILIHPGNTHNKRLEILI